jgi:hypothetical protein
VKALSMRWKDFRFHFFDRNPQLFGAFEASLDELQAMVFDFSVREKYDLTRHALAELGNLLADYLIARDRSLRVPTSTMAMFFPSEMGFDPVLTRQLERLKAHAARGISNSDQEFVKQVTRALATLGLASMQSRSYFTEHGENSVTTFVSVYLSGCIEDAAVRKLDDVALEGADHLRDLCKALIEKGLYISAVTHINNLEKLANISVLNRSDVVLSAAVRALSDCLLHNVTHAHPGTHITRHLLQSLMRVMHARLASPLGLEMMNVSFSVGPFISPAERSSFAAVNIAIVNGIVEMSRADQREALSRLRSLYEELHDRVWLDFAELGVEAVKKNSFLLHYINSTIEEVVKANCWLVNALDLPAEEGVKWEVARERDRSQRFRAEVEKKIGWETTGIYSRIIPAMFEHRKLSYLEDAIKLQSLFAFWSIRAPVQKVALDAIERIFKACMLLQDPQYKDTYGSARLAINVAQVGIYAIALGDELVFRTALEKYGILRRAFSDRYPDLHFVGDFDSAESELTEERYSRGGLVMLDSRDREFFSTTNAEHIRDFFAALD